ncbi:hypothetical protein DFJ74DRAFT_675615 [Hyaloraphidium curvatum]|nr:hypothetical protein DFJ74DRAFT_675615 [Hyaloraphidium curvatum]
MALFAQLLGQMTGQGAGQQGGDPLAGLLGAPPGDQGPRQRRGQASQPGSQPQAQMPMDNPLAALLGANAPPGMASMLQNMMKPTHPAVAEMRAEEELRRKEELRRARPWRIVGILCSAAVALFALYLLATSGSVVDMGDVDADGDAQVGEYTGWRSGAARIARLRLGSSEVLDDLGAEAVGYVSPTGSLIWKQASNAFRGGRQPIWLIFLMSEVTLHLLRIGAASILDTSISTPPRPSSDRPPAAAGFFRRFGLVFTMLRDDLAAFVFVIGLGVVLASLV